MHRTLVTGAGGPAAICFLRAQDAFDGFYMADMDPLAPGLFLVPEDRRVILPAGKAPEFIEHLLDCCRFLGITRLVPTVDAELLPIARQAARFEALGIQLVLSPLEALETCLDKLRLHLRCRRLVPSPATVLAGRAPTATGPWIAKPRSGSGSRGIRMVDASTLASVPADGNWLIQECLPGAEYSVDVLIGPNGEALAAVPRERLRVDSGVATVARTVKDPQLQRLALDAAQLVGIRGVANVQLKRDANGMPKLMEINPRFPGTMALTVEAGANLPKLVMDIAEDKTVTSPEWKETAMVRTFSETFVDPALFAAVDKASEAA